MSLWNLNGNHTSYYLLLHETTELIEFVKIIVSSYMILLINVEIVVKLNSTHHCHLWKVKVTIEVPGKTTKGTICLYSGKISHLSKDVLC